MKRSFSLRAFNRYETEINEHFWSFKVISEYSRFIAKGHERQDPNYPTKNAFSASGPDADRIPTTVKQWLDAREELENWLRLSALVSAAAYHEAYLRQILRSTLMSDPLLRQGASRIIDGTYMLKQGVELDYTHEVTLITRGDWQARASNFEKLFGAPSSKAFPIRELEEIRKIRNDFAHGFGRELDIPEPSEFEIPPAHRISQAKFIKFIGTMSRSAAAIDKHLLSNFIGDFELVHALHKWKSSGDRGTDRGRTEARAFKKYLHGKRGVSRDSNFCTELMAYYDGV